MKYSGRALGKDQQLSIETEGLRIGSMFYDFADFSYIKPINHKVIIDFKNQEQLEISMLGFSFDGFWEELSSFYANRNLEALFVDEKVIMRCEGEYSLPDESGRGIIDLYPDSVCILPPSSKAVRIPLCFTDSISLDGYELKFSMNSGNYYMVGKMGYDTKPFAQRAEQSAALVKKEREKAMSAFKIKSPYTDKGMFRTKQSDYYWNAALGEGVCALEFFTDEDTATYLYRFNETKDTFLMHLREATEAMGIHREIIYLSDDKINEKPLYRMAVERSESVRFLRERLCQRLIHNQNHEKNLIEFLEE